MFKNKSKDIDADCKSKIGNYQYLNHSNIPAKTRKWNVNWREGKWYTNDRHCWISWQYNQTISSPKPRIQPPLDNCYNYTENACCNYAEDMDLFKKTETLVPASCPSKFGHLEILSCLACTPTLFDYIIKAEASLNYIKAIQVLMNK